MKKNQRNRLVFWDWTGTLADESRLDQAVCLEIEKALATRHQLSLDKAARLFRDYLKSLENTWEWHDYVRHSQKFGLPWKKFQRLHLNKLRLLPQAKEILLWSKKMGYRNILATNAVRKVVMLRLNYLKIQPLFEAIITSDDVGHLKESGLHFARGLKLFAAKPADCFSVGDNPIQDIASAQRLGLKTIYCAFGQKFTHYHTSHLSPNRQEPVPADYTISSLLEVKGILDFKKKGKKTNGELE